MSWGIQNKNSLNLILGFGFNKGLLNLNNSCIKKINLQMTKVKDSFNKEILIIKNFKW
jgi:hypothetical protein